MNRSMHVSKIIIWFSDKDDFIMDIIIANATDSTNVGNILFILLYNTTCQSHKNFNLIRYATTFLEFFRIYKMVPNHKIIWTIEKFPENTYSQQKKDIIISLHDAFEEWGKFINCIFTYSENIKNIDLKEYSCLVSIGFYSGTHLSCTSETHEKISRTFDGKHGILAHASESSTRNRYIHFDSDEDWCYNRSLTLNNFFTYRPVLYNVALHEIGHILGLRHSSQLSSIMYYSSSRFINKLSRDDIENVQKIFYSEKDEKKPNTGKNESIVITTFKIYYKEFIVLGCLLLLLLQLRRDNIRKKMI